MAYNQKAHILLIIGASGCGKTTTTRALKKLFSPKNTAFYYFDDIGWPSREEMIAQCGTTEKWQEWATQVWLNQLIKIKGKKLVVLEGSFYPNPAVSYLQRLGVYTYSLICIHTNREAREKRLSLFRKQPELATQDMENYAQTLRQQTLDLGYTVIDSSHKKVEEVAEELYNLIMSSILK